MGANSLLKDHQLFGEIVKIGPILQSTKSGLDYTDEQTAILPRGYGGRFGGGWGQNPRGNIL